MSRIPWQKWEDDLVIQHYRIEGIDFILGLLKARTRLAVKNRASYLKVTAKREPEWTLAEINIVRDHYPNLRKALRLLPGRTYDAIQSLCSLRLKLGSRKSWQSAEDDLIRKLAATHTDAQLAGMLGRTIKALAQRRLFLGNCREMPARRTPSQLVQDIKSEAKRRHVKLQPLVRALGHSNIESGSRYPQARAIGAVVRSFGGELYAEWDD
jgi:hypothetical protein